MNRVRLPRPLEAALLLVPVALACSAGGGDDDSGDGLGSTGGAPPASGGAPASSGGSPAASDGATSSGGSTASGGDMSGSGGADPGGCVPDLNGTPVDNGDGTVSDPRTCLMWQKETTVVNAGTTGAEHISSCGNESTGGHSDWRGPSSSELASILSTCPSGWSTENLWGEPFDNLGAGYWTADMAANGVMHNCLILNNTGAYTDRRADTTIYVRCVRGTGMAPMVATCDTATGCADW